MKVKVIDNRNYSEWRH